MQFDIITLFPELFTPFLHTGVTRRAYASGQIAVHCHNPRDFSSDRRVDGRVFGGGPGMVMMAEPLSQCVSHIQSRRANTPPVVLFSPIGHPLNHAMVARWAGRDGAILVCGRYEGVDQRFIDTHVTEHISLGDFVLSGGEIAALAFLDAIARLQPCVLHDAQSHAEDSFNQAVDGLLDCPHYTRPQVWRHQTVPEVLTSGNHEHIVRWRRNQRLALTARWRPDLIAHARQNNLLTTADEAFLTTLK